MSAKKNFTQRHSVAEVGVEIELSDTFEGRRCQKNFEWNVITDGYQNLTTV